MYDTELHGERLNAEFQLWKSQFAPDDSGLDYDLPGAFLAGVRPDAKGHWPDRFKKPNHPTFSTESQYYGYAPDRAGYWEGDTFIPPKSESNIRFTLVDSTSGTYKSVELCKLYEYVSPKEPTMAICRPFSEEAAITHPGYDKISKDITADYMSFMKLRWRADKGAEAHFNIMTDEGHPVMLIYGVPEPLAQHLVDIHNAALDKKEATT